MATRKPEGTPPQARKQRASPRPAARGARVAIVTARWNHEITDALEEGAATSAAEAGAEVERFSVSGSFELPAAVALLADTGRYDAIVPVGCLIRGETPHFEVLAHAVARSLAELSITYRAAIPFGVLTCDSVAQARARAGGREGNQGAEAMAAALELVGLRRRLSRKRASPGSSRASESHQP